MISLIIGRAQSPAPAVQQVPLISAWLQHVLHKSCQSMHTSSSSLQMEQQQQQRQQQQASERSGGSTSRHSVASDVSARGGAACQFSVRPSALSPLHPYHREILTEQRRLLLLHHTLKAHIKLAQELNPQELQTHAASPDPVSAALSARRTSLQAVVDSYHHLLNYNLGLRAEPDTMLAYYAAMEGLIKDKDSDVKQFQQVVDGKRSVWDYWFQHFAPQYAGLPGLGTLESIYNQQTEEEVLRQQLSQLQAQPQKPPPQPQIDRLGRAAAVGGRKTSVARVYLWRGQGRILVNRKPIDAYFSDLLMRSHVLKPLMTVGLVDQLDVLVHVHGGGVSGQAQAAAHGIAKALVKLEPGLKPTLKSAKLLRRDPRAVERKKFGRAKARKGFGWVKR